MTTGLVDATPAMQHVQRLFAKGMSIDRMHEVSGINRRSLHGFNTGRYRERTVKSCTPGMLARVLAIPYSQDWTPEGFDPVKMRAARDAVGVSRVALAKAAGLCPETIQYWESGRSRPTRKANIDRVLHLLGVGWEDVSVSEPVDDGSDAYEMIFSEGRIGADTDYVPKYPCHVCGVEFKSRTLLATHPHPKRKVHV